MLKPAGMIADVPDPEIRPLGIDGILVRFSRDLSVAANNRALQFRDQVLAAQITGVTEAASSLTSVRIGFDPAKTDRQVVSAAIMALLSAPQNTTDSPKRLWRIPAAFGPDYAPQLAEAAAGAGLTPDQAVADITSQVVRVMAIGFAPGQPYLGMLPAQWDIPRQDRLTESLPRGALICAVRQLMIWAADAPTGWRHIGQTAFRVYRPEAPDPFAFAPGDAVQFHAVSDATFRDILSGTDSNGGAVCKVLS